MRMSPVTFFVFLVIFLAIPAYAEGSTGYSWGSVLFAICLAGVMALLMSMRGGRRAADPEELDEDDWRDEQ